MFVPKRPASWASVLSLLFSVRSEEHTSELQSPYDLVCRLLLEKKNEMAVIQNEQTRGDMDTTYKQEVRVGALVLFGFATFIALLFWLTDRRVGAQGVRMTVRFDNVAGLDQGDPVMVSGVKVGRVEGVRLLRGGKGDVILNVNREERPRIDATAASAALDFW